MKNSKVQEKMFAKPAEKLVKQIKEKNAVIVELSVCLFIA